MKHNIFKRDAETWIEFPEHGIWASVYPWDARTSEQGLEVYPFVVWQEVEGDESQLIHSDEVLCEDWDTNGVLSILHHVKACVIILAMTGEEETK